MKIHTLIPSSMFHFTFNTLKVLNPTARSIEPVGKPQRTTHILLTQMVQVRESNNYRFVEAFVVSYVMYLLLSWLQFTCLMCFFLL